MTAAERLLPLFPLVQVVLYPGMSLPLRIFEERYKLMVGACEVNDQVFGVLLIRSGTEVGAPAEPERVGCTARMLRVNRLTDGQMLILAVGVQRFRLVGGARVTPEGYLVGNARLLDDEVGAGMPTDLLSSVAAEFGRYRTETLAGPDEPLAHRELASDPLRLSYEIAASLRVDPRERQYLLEVDDTAKRLRDELSLLRRENRPFSIGPFSIN